MDRPDRPRDQPGPSPRPWSDQDIRARLDRLPPNHPSSPRYRRAHDTPRQADQQPERERPWYAPHAAREQAIERERRDQAPGTDPRQWRDDSYQQRHHDIPARFREDVAQRVPHPPGLTDPTTGRLDRQLGDRGGLPLDSGYKTGLVDALQARLGRLPEAFTAQNKTHTEAHAAAWLHLHPDIREATLYINRPPCKGTDGCGKRLPAMLPPGTQLTVYGPDNFWRVYHGQRPEQGGP